MDRVSSGPSSSMENNDTDARSAVVVDVGKVAVEPQKEGGGEDGVVLGGEKCVVVDVEESAGSGKGESEEGCRICHLDPDPLWLEGSEVIQLGCACKNELGMAHRHCAEAWFRLRGGRSCEICGVSAKNVTMIEDNNFMARSGGGVAVIFSNESSLERYRCWSSQPFCKFLLACLVIAFVLSWFFRVNMF